MLLLAFILICWQHHGKITLCSKISLRRIRMIPASAGIIFAISQTLHKRNEHVILGAVWDRPCSTGADRQILNAGVDRSPGLPPSALFVILDNLGAHKVNGVRQLIERCSASVLCHPTHLTSTPLNKPVPSSSDYYAESKPARRATGASLNPGHRRHYARTRRRLFFRHRG